MNVAAINTQDSLVYNDRSQSDFDHHNNMLTVLPLGQEQDQSKQQAIVFNNDFISKNKYMLSFYREHDAEKRQLFAKLRDECEMRARLNREIVQDHKRSKVMNFMSRWDEYRVRREIVVKALMQVQKRQSACRFWLVTNALIGRLKSLSAVMEAYREEKAKKEKEMLRQQQIRINTMQQEEANRSSQSDESNYESEQE